MWSISWIGGGVGVGHAGQGIWLRGMKLLSFPQSWSWHWGSSQMGPQGKAMGDSFSVDQNTKTKIAGWLGGKVGPCTDHIFLIPKVRRPPQPHTHKKCSLEAKGELCQGVFYPDTFSVKFMLRDPCSHMWGSWDIRNMDCEPGKLKWLVKGKPKEMTHISDLNCHEGATQGLCLWVCPCVYPHLLNSFPLNK